MRRRLRWTMVLCATLAWACGLHACARGGADARGEPRQETLDTPREISGIPCATRAFFAADGRLLTCTLSRDFTFGNGVRLDAGSQVSLDAEGWPGTVFLPRNTIVDGHHCIGDGSHDPMTKLHPNGRLKFCNLVAPEKVQGVTCQRSTFWIWVTQGAAGITFHDNGALDRCLLAEDAEIGGRRLARRTHAQFDRDGRLVTTAGK